MKKKDRKRLVAVAKICEQLLNFSCELHTFSYHIQILAAAINPFSRVQNVYENI